MKGGDLEGAAEQWSPTISLGTSVLIPETYVADLQLRLGLYRRLSTLETREEIDGFAAELVDRFGPLPEEVEHLLDVMEIKALCRQAGIAQVDAGPRGAVVGLTATSSPTRKGWSRSCKLRAATSRCSPTKSSFTAPNGICRQSG